MPYSLSGTSLLIYEYTPTGLILSATMRTATDTPPTTADIFAVGARVTNIDDGIVYINIGTSASPTWSLTRKTSVATATATSDGLTTGLITSGTTFVTVTSSSATNAVTLPAITSATIGQTIDIAVGSNGYELLTPASSNNTINTVDSDGTNQLDVAANTVLRCVQSSATGWFCYQVAATTITVVAPDND